MQNLSDSRLLDYRIIFQLIDLIEVSSLGELTVANKVDHIFGPGKLLSQ